MTKIKIDQLIWDEWNIKHIRKHSISQQEVEEAIINVVAHRKGYRRRIILIGRSKTRILSVIAVKEHSSKYYVITARDADKKERKLIYKYEKENKQNS